MKPENSQFAVDAVIVWPLLLAAFLVAGFFGFAFFAFSGRVTLSDPVVAGLVGSALTQMANLLGMVGAKYYATVTPRTDGGRAADRKSHHDLERL